MERTNDWIKFESLGSGASQEQPRQWKGKTGGGKFGQKSLFCILRRMNVAFLYPVLFIVVPFYMLFARKGYLSIMRYFRQCYGMSVWNSFRQTFVNHLLFGQIVLDKFAALVGNIRYFTADITG
ncbi:MAG: hypothetical protein LBQ64_04000, partial [Bacteroidales bacterium]|nr:hypothetical protein [Bacteroidales bacterium]